MNHKEMLSHINDTLGIANTTNSDLLSGLVILSAVATERCIADLICSETDKIDYAINNNVPVADLAVLNNSVAQVLNQVCCIEGKIVDKIKQGIALRE